jgi:hypothetical protein
MSFRTGAGYGFTAADGRIFVGFLRFKRDAD